MGNFATIALAISIGYWSNLNTPRAIHDPKPVTTMRWYMAQDGHKVHCSGRPFFVYPPLQRAVDGCSGPKPQVILKD